jgi:acyl-CoA synthetase (AMP-forming)/AMP-acid ligase II
MADCRLLAAVLDGNADEAPTALTDTGALTRAQFRAGVEAWRIRFTHVPGLRIGLYHEDAAFFAQRLLGAWAAGKLVHLPGDRLPATVARLTGQVDAVAGDLPGALKLETDETHSLPLPATPAEVALVINTSGSSGEPVAVGKRLAQLDAEIAALEQRFGAELGAAEIAGTVSHQHIYGLLFRVLWPLASGRPVHARRLSTPEQIAAVPGTGPLVLIASPAHLKRVPEAVDWAPLRARLVRVFSSGGALPPDASDAVAGLWGQRPVEVFGSTETGGIAERTGPQAAWTPLPGVAWRLEGEQLQVRSPHLASDAWYATADRAQPCDAGFVLLGRADRIAKIEERRISLDAIEQRLLTSPWIAAARVIVLPGDRVRVAVVAETTPDGAARLAYAGRAAFVRDARGWLAEHVDPVAMPRRWRFVDHLPVNAQGKTTEAALAALFRPTLPTPHWLERGANAASLEFDADPDLVPFEGHFPQAAVLPGVAQLDWALHFGRDAFALQGEPRRVEQLKFQALVRPDLRVRLALDWTPATGVLAFRYTSEAGTHASGRFVFATDAT